MSIVSRVPKGRSHSRMGLNSRDLRETKYGTCSPFPSKNATSYSTNQVSRHDTKLRNPRNEVFPWRILQYNHGFVAGIRPFNAVTCYVGYISTEVDSQYQAIRPTQLVVLGDSYMIVSLWDHSSSPVG